MKKIGIKSKKQDNGLWGTPLNCIVIDKIPLLDSHKLLIFSAILIAFDEKYNINFRIHFSTDNSFVIMTYGNGNFSMRYENYEVLGNTLYEFDNENMS